jgi:hypothetical protein
MAALEWLRNVAATGDVPAAMRRDLGLPYAASAGVAFASEVERSRLRL